MSLGQGIGVELNQDGFSWFNGSFFLYRPSRDTRTLNSKLWEKVCAETIGKRGWFGGRVCKGRSCSSLELNRIRKGAASKTEEI